MMSTWLLFMGFLASGIVTALTLKKFKFRLALPLYLFTFIVLSLYIPIFSGCSLMVRFSTYIFPGLMGKFFIEVLTSPLSATLQYVSVIYIAYMAVSFIMAVATVLVAVFTVRAVIRFIGKFRHSREFTRPANKLCVFRGTLNLQRNTPELSRLCRFNC